MGFLSAMKGANNVWGTIICSDGVGTIGPENFLNNTKQTLMVTLGFKTFIIEKNDIKSVKIIDTSAEWIKYLLTLKNGKTYVAILMMLAPSQTKKKSLTASDNGKKINMAVQNFEWWMYDFLYPNNKEQKNNVETKRQNKDTSIKKNEVVESVEDDSIQPVQNIEESWCSDYELDDDLINQPNEDECPCCFSKIKPDDIECNYCGYKLK